VTTTYVPVNDTSRVNLTSRLIVLPEPAAGPEAGGMTAPRALRTAAAELAAPLLVLAARAPVASAAAYAAAGAATRFSLLLGGRGAAGGGGGTATAAAAPLLPPSVRLLSLRLLRSGPGEGAAIAATLRVRLVHMYEAGEDPALSRPATVSLAALFGRAPAALRVTGVREVGLAGFGPAPPSSRQREGRRGSEGVVLEPSEIRTFEVDVIVGGEN